jgi:peptide/nickel transport system substrate-binding protein
VSQGITTVVNGTAFEINFVATNTSLHSDIATEVQTDLGQCGIKVNINLQTIDKMYAAGPDGLLFGRNFDLAEFGWTTGSQPPCFLYSSTEVPTARNNWLGTKHGGVNITGYSNPAYDQACELQLTSGLDQATIDSANKDAMTILANDLPVLPLFYHLKIMVSRPDLCGLTFDVSSRSGLRTIETVKNGADCPAN